jgi:hypothetical protein
MHVVKDAAIDEHCTGGKLADDNSLAVRRIFDWYL